MPLTAAELRERVDALVWPSIPAILIPWQGSSSAEAPLSFAYRFATSQPGDLWANFGGWTAMSAAEQQSVRAALAQFAEIVNVTFTEASGAADPDLNFGRVSFPAGLGGQGGFNYSYFTSNGEVTSRIWDGFAVFNRDLDLASETNLLLHEIGHAMGLKHPGDYDAGGGSSPGPYLPAAEDNNRFTVMSYNEHDVTGDLPSSLMLYDMAALQALWGANYNTRAGNTTYFGPGSAPGFALADGGETVTCIWDGGGRDTISAANQSLSVTIDLRAGSFSSIGSLENNVAIAYGARIENAEGGDGADKLTGNAGPNLLSGNEGKDVLHGGRGRDTLDGGAGSDRLFGGQGPDRFYFAAFSDSPNHGRDVIRGFSSAQNDRIHMRDLGSFDFIGKSGFSGAGDEVRFVSKAGKAVVLVDDDGDRKPDLAILLPDVATLAAGDFVL